MFQREVSCLLFVCVLLLCLDLMVSGYVLSKTATSVTTMNPSSAAVMLFLTDTDDLKRGSNGGTSPPTSENDDNSVIYTGRVNHFNFFGIQLYQFCRMLF